MSGRPAGEPGTARHIGAWPVWRSGAFWIIVGVNLLLLGLYLWSRGGSSMDVRIEVLGDEFRAFVDGRLIVEGETVGPEEGGVAFALGRTSTLPSLPGPMAIDHVRVTGAETGEVLLEEDFGGDDARLAVEEGDWRLEGGALALRDMRGRVTTGPQEWSDYIVEATFQNPISLNVFFRMENADNRMSFVVHPYQDYRTYVEVVEDGAAISRTNGRRLQLEREETIKSILAMVLRSYPIAALIVGGTLAIALVARWAWLDARLLDAARSVGQVGTSLAVVMALWALVLLWYINYVIGDAMPHVPDSVGYVFQAKVFASFRLTADAPPVRESFSYFHPHMLQVVDGRWFSHYPFGHPLFLAIGQLVRAPWLVPPAVGGLSLVLIYFTGRRVHGTLVGLLAASLLLFSPFFQMTASNFMSHNTGAFTLLATLFFLTRPWRRRAIGMFTGGLFLGLCFNIRPLSAVAFMPVLGVFLLYELLRAAPAERRGLAVEYLSFGAGGLLMLLAYFGYNAATTGDVFQSQYAQQGTFTEDTFGFGGGHTVEFGLQNQQVHIALLLLVANGWPVLVGFAFAALPFLLGTRHRWDYFLLASFVAVGGAQMLYFRAPIMHGPRFWYEAMPFLTLLTARGAQYLIDRASAWADWLAPRLWPRTPAHASGAPGLAVLALVVGLTAHSAYGWMLERQDLWSNTRFTPQKISMLEGFNFTDDRLLEEAAEMDLEDALVIVEQCTGQWWCYGSVFWTNSPDLAGDIVWAERQTNRDDLALLEAFPDRAVYLADYDEATIRPVTRAEIRNAVRDTLAGTPEGMTPAERDEKRREDLATIEELLAQYRELNGSYPTTDSNVQTFCVFHDLDAGCTLRALAEELPSDPLGEPIANGYWWISEGQRYVLIAQAETELEDGGCPPEALPPSGEPRFCVTGPPGEAP